MTAIGLLASLASLIQASHSLLTILTSLRNGDTELSELCSDVSIFAEALKGFDRVLRSRQAKHGISATIISSALERASATIQKLESRIEHISKHDISAMRRVKWVQHKSSLKSLHENLRNQSIMLQSFLILAQTFVISACGMVTPPDSPCLQGDLNGCIQTASVFLCGIPISHRRIRG